MPAAYRIARQAYPRIEKKTCLPAVSDDKGEEKLPGHTRFCADCFLILPKERLWHFLTIGDPSVYSHTVISTAGSRGVGQNVKMISGVPSFLRSCGSLEYRSRITGMRSM